MSQVNQKLQAKNIKNIRLEKIATNASFWVLIALIDLAIEGVKLFYPMNFRLLPSYTIDLSLGVIFVFIGLLLFFVMTQLNRKNPSDQKSSQNLIAEEISSLIMNFAGGLILYSVNNCIVKSPDEFPYWSIVVMAVLYPLAYFNLPHNKVEPERKSKRK